ncbi:MAG: hypothetical protein IJH34_06430 [Romboutsia sp.]|nr:hypothetical protein [Romboutsia sp.]
MAEKDLFSKYNAILKRSIVTIINSFIKNTEKRAILLDLHNNFFSIKVYGKFEKDITQDSCLIKSLLNLSTQVYYVTTTNQVKVTKSLDFSEYKSGVYKIKDLSVLSSDEKNDNVTLIFYKSNFKEPLKLLCKENIVNDLRLYINDIYNDAFSYLKIKCFDEILESKNKAGLLLNEDNIEASDNTNIYIYKMTDYFKAFDIVINGIKVPKDITEKFINCKKYPFRQKGYSFRKMYLIMQIKIEDLDINDESQIELIYKKKEKNLIEILENYKEYFLNNKVYFNMDYDKEKMKYILKKSGYKNYVEAVKYILDNYLEENK